MLFAHARHFRRPVQNRNEVWVEAGAAPDVAGLAGDEEAWVEAQAEALCAGAGAG